MSCIVLLGDAHLRDGDREIDAFLMFLDSLPPGATALYLLGDLFDLWIGAPAFHTPAHGRVVEALLRLREKGVRISYVEGNRDYHLRRAYGGDPFEDVAEAGLEVAFGARRIFLAHGDLVNRMDRPYRIWRRVAKGPWLLGLFRLLPARWAAHLADRLERRIAATNLRHRIGFPEAECRDYALGLRRRGFDTLVLGHFHREMERTYAGPEGRIQVFVLPSWREEGRHLRIEGDGTAVFEAFRTGGTGGTE